MLILLLVIFGLMLLCLSVIFVVASFNDEFKNALERSIGEGSSQRITKFDKYEPIIQVPEIVLEVDMEKNNEVPEQWNPQLITEKLRRVRNNPALLQYFFESIKERLILGQDYRTSNSRIRFLQNQIKELHIAKEYLSALDNLSFHEIEREIRHRELELKKEDLENKRKAQQELEDLRLESEKLRIKVELARLTKEKEEIENPGSASVSTSPPPNPTSEQE